MRRLPGGLYLVHLEGLTHMSHDTASIAAKYVQRGWGVTPLHDVSGNTCSCGSAEPTHAREGGGKHPLINAWQARPIRNEREARETWAGRPMANIGILTGPVSGLWVLDIDPEHDGHHALTQLVATHGPLPDTYTVTTGSGGTHYYWRMPDWDLTNRRGSLPNGIDVRGRGGFVVAPPSISGKGAYYVASPAEVAEAPAWLLELLRPREVVMPNPAFNDVRQSLAPAGPGVYDRGVAYATEAVQQRLYELSTAPPGQRNARGFSVACRLVELGNARWSGLEPEALRQAFMAAADMANTDGSFNYIEHGDLWRKATNHVGQNAAILPAADWLGETVAWGLPRDAVDFSGGPSAPIGNTAPPAPMFHDPFADPGESFGQGAPTSTPQASAFLAPGAGQGAPLLQPMGPIEYAAEKAYHRILGEKQAKARIKAEAPAGEPFRFLTGAELDLIPAPEALVEGWIYRDTLARLWGPSGAGKSHVAVDLAASIATGRQWHGCPVKQGTVVYVVAEGASGMGQRRRAWQEHHGVDPSAVRWVTAPVQVMGPDWDRFIAAVVEIGPSLVVLDTQARVTEGVDENDNTAMGEVVGALERLREATKACVLLVHHQGTGDADRARGASAVKGAMATELSVSKRPGQAEVTVRNVKQKDAAEAIPLVLTLTPVADSVVLLGATEARMGPDGFMDPPPAVIPVADRNAITMIEVMRETFGEGQGGTKAEIVATWKAHPANQGLPVATARSYANRTWARLEGLGRIAINPTARSKFKFAEVEGLGSLDRNEENLSDAGWNVVKRTDAPREPKKVRNTGRNTGSVTH